MKILFLGDIVGNSGCRAIKDNLSIDYCDQNNMSMVLTGIRHFKH